MEYVAKIIPVLKEILHRNNKASINITTKENEIIVSILTGRRWKRFKDKNVDNVYMKIRNYFPAISL